MVPLADAAFLMLEFLRVVGCYGGPIDRSLDVRMYYKTRSTVLSYRMPEEDVVYVNGLLVQDECQMASALAFHSTGIIQERYEEIVLDRERYANEATECCYWGKGQ